MFFTSPTFFAFLAVVLTLHYTLPWRVNRWILVAASYFLYGTANPWYCLLLLASTTVDFQAGRALDREDDPARRRRWLAMSLTANLGMLGTFKYAGFTADNLNALLALVGGSTAPVPDWVLPVGISFYTFQTLSYTIDVYRRRTPAEQDFGTFALYVAFFPQLVAGPIERAHRLIPQLAQRPVPSRLDLEEGFQRVLWGLVKKTVFADRLALPANQVFADPAAHSAPELALATMCFSFQLYLDFSAYSDIAIGLARMMGIRLSENFNYPFLARNPVDFWSRWHITLTTWFRDYAFTALGGAKRHRPWRTALNVIGVMTLVGLWHGAAWNFVAFGLLSGLTVAGHQLIRVARGPRRGPLLGTGPVAVVLSIVVANIVINFMMVFFRSPDLATAGAVLSGIATGPWTWSPAFNVPLALLLVVWALHIARGTGADRFARLRPAAPLRAVMWFAMMLAIVYGAVDVSEPFIYFRF